MADLMRWWVVPLLVAAVALMAGQCHAVRARVVLQCLYSAADCQDYRISAVLDCLTPFKSGESSNPISGKGDLYQ